VPAGDIGVGGREIGYMFGQYKRLTNRYEAGVFTGKALAYGGSRARTEATGYGNTYFVEAMLATRGQTFDGKRRSWCRARATSRSTRSKRSQAFGGKVVACSDSGGYVVDENGIDLALVKEIKEVRRERISEYARRAVRARISSPARARSGMCPAMSPCLRPPRTNCRQGCETLVKNGVIAVGEGANMPSTPEAVRMFQEAGVLFAPGKAANAGGVATSALEMQQNASRDSWTFDHAQTEASAPLADDHALGIHDTCHQTRRSEYRRAGRRTMCWAPSYRGLPCTSGTTRGQWHREVVQRNQGFRFHRPAGRREDVFVHISALERAGIRSLNDGQAVTFELERDRNGRESAVNLALA
jgi:glutamate dehydrogenase (NADP+)